MLFMKLTLFFAINFSAYVAAASWPTKSLLKSIQSEESGQRLARLKSTYLSLRPLGSYSRDHAYGEEAMVNLLFEFFTEDNKLDDSKWNRHIFLFAEHLLVNSGWKDPSIHEATRKIIDRAKKGKSVEDIEISDAVLNAYTEVITFYFYDWPEIDQSPRSISNFVQEQAIYWGDQLREFLESNKQAERELKYIATEQLRHTNIQLESKDKDIMYQCHAAHYMLDLVLNDHLLPEVLLKEARKKSCHYNSDEIFKKQYYR